MTILREWRAELRRELADEYVAYIRDTGLAEYRATPGNLGALIAVRDLDDDRAEVITLSWWPSMDAIRRRVRVRTAVSGGDRSGLRHRRQRVRDDVRDVGHWFHFERLEHVGRDVVQVGLVALRDENR